MKSIFAKNCERECQVGGRGGGGIEGPDLTSATARADMSLVGAILNSVGNELCSVLSSVAVDIGDSCGIPLVCRTCCADLVPDDA